MRKRMTCCLLLLFLLMSLPESSDALPFTPIQILIDVGHGGVDSGTTYGSLHEKDINLQVAKELYRQLTDAGYKVALNRSEDIALSEENRWLNNRSRHLRDLAQRRNLAKLIDPQLMISLHVNWSSDSKRRGPLMLYQSNEQSYMLAQLLQSSLNRLAETSHKPVKGKTYYMLRHNYCPSVIVEMGFISNARDRAMMTDSTGQKKLAQAIRDAVSEYITLTGGMQMKVEEQEVEESWWQELMD
ncbi:MULTISPECIES: N-acetylmuramoyl-L-alanine amidase [Brevibacillus]|uniref:N-acetylmuramoyl-L-alanine amidase n=1 Tax=Brevibacillus invocatus TaxID=173959 RepID=A0A3M8C214_9BACL|nr:MULTISPECIES: N-acetylmuramoyl-L-alanine amidase [Brevibacillus]MCM3079464.1 N-acetylmuramoyl-L-alanine amidase [Brevibacillus invocatus]MCM3429484.1 N-acetylmuramoyl-L-alanine amidase [Brevibacillus invocatus]MDH4618199.1 N-acetylmuramoyl-L-alanine amidase [Brevibacillus sp. AY1]RNB69533.1 N-acetylmuramoyl-L-alanine amidase [Brevibacillus invocatus]